MLHSLQNYDLSSRASVVYIRWAMIDEWVGGGGAVGDAKEHLLRGEPGLA